MVGTETELTTPTAVAAIRGTKSSQFVPNATQSTHALNEGVEDITELITGQTVTITDGQIDTAIRGVGFTPIVALLALIPKPDVGGGGGSAAGGDIATTVPLEIRSEARPASPSRPDNFPGPQDFPGRGWEGFPGIGDFPGVENFRENSRGRGNARR